MGHVWENKNPRFSLGRDARGDVLGHEGNPAAGPPNAWGWGRPFPHPEPWLQHPSTLLWRLLGCEWGDPVPFPPSLSKILALVVAGDGWRGQPELSPLGSRTGDEPPIPHAAFGDKTASKSPPGCLIPLPCTTWVPRTPVHPLGRNAGQRRDPQQGQVTTFGADPGAGRDR